MFCRSLCYKDYAVLEASAKVNKKPNSSTFICLSIRNFVAATGYSFVFWIVTLFLLHITWVKYPTPK